MSALAVMMVSFGCFCFAIGFLAGWIVFSGR